MAGANKNELARIDRAITTQLDILRHSSNVEAKILVLIEQMRKELIARLASSNMTEWNKARTAQLLRDTTNTINDYYARAQKLIAPSYEAVANVTAQQSAIGIAAALPSKTVLNSVVSDLLIEGSPAKQWWSKMATDTAFRFSAAIRQGVVQGETQDQILKRVNDAIGVAGKNSKALTHTSIMTVMNDANLTTLKENADIVPSVRWLATLDSSTCPSCGARDGLEWDTITGDPIGHDIQFENPPLHFGCRCKLVGMTELLKQADGQRASMFGPVSRKVTFSEFLERRPQEFQEEVLGKGRAELFREKKLTLRDLVSGDGSPLTLNQLKKKYN